jgi:hypothetical protein
VDRGRVDDPARRGARESTVQSSPTGRSRRYIVALSHYPAIADTGDIVHIGTAEVVPGGIESERRQPSGVQ